MKHKLCRLVGCRLVAGCMQLVLLISNCQFVINSDLKRLHGIHAPSAACPDAWWQHDNRLLIWSAWQDFYIQCGPCKQNQRLR